MLLLSISSLLRNIFLILLIIIAFRWITSLFRVKTARRYASTQPHQAKDDVTLRFNNKGEKIIDKNKGEYVEFEEVD